MQYPELQPESDSRHPFISGVCSPNLNTLRTSLSWSEVKSRRSFTEPRPLCSWKEYAPWYLIYILYVD